MNSKTVKPVTATDYEVHDMRIHVEGLESLGIIDGKESFLLKGLSPTHVDWTVIGDALETAGIPRERAESYVEMFANKIIQGELSHTLAERIKVIGIN